MTGVDWIAVDWGTSRLRAWAMSDAGEALAEASSDDGMATLGREGFKPALLALVGGWLAPDRATQVIACGMVGARQGWVEAGYRAVPCPPLGPDGFVTAPSRDLRLSVRILPGLSQSQPADVMRGEETQIAGYLATNPGFDGVLCLPGTHSKWVRISAGEVVGFQTYMTGELFALLTEHSVLRHSTGGSGWDQPAFLAAVSDALAHPERLAARLFTLRAETLLHGLGADAARARLSGLLIGAEFAAARVWWLGQDLGIIGAPALAANYAAALVAQGAAPRLAEAGPMTLAGLTAARAMVRQ